MLQGVVETVRASVAIKTVNAGASGARSQPLKKRDSAWTINTKELQSAKSCPNLEVGLDLQEGAKAMLEVIGAELDPSLREHLYGIVHHVAYPAKTIVFSEGEEATACYLVLTGSVSVYRASVHNEGDSDSEDAGSEEEEIDPNEPFEEHKLCVFIESAADLKEDQKLDPFCVVKLGTQKIETPVIQNSGSCPVWDYEGSLPVERGAKELTFEVWEYDKFSKNDLLGIGTISLKKIKPGAHFSKQVELQLEGELPGSAGHLQVRISWDSSQGLWDDQERRSISNQSNARSEERPSDASGFESSMGFQIASLGPGKLFGELALMSEEVRSASVRCETHCEFAKVEKVDFERLLKEDLKRAQVEKRLFFYRCVPGLTSLLPRTADELLYYFRKRTVTRGFSFLKQGSIAEEASIFFIIRGTVELSWKDLSSSSSQKGMKVRVGLLGEGQVFGSPKNGEAESLSAVATAASVDVWSIRLTQLRRFPYKILSEIQAKVSLTSAWHSQRCVEGSKTKATFNKANAEINMKEQTQKIKSQGVMSSPFLKSKSSSLPVGYVDNLPLTFPMYKPHDFADRFPKANPSQKSNQGELEHAGANQRQRVSAGARHSLPMTQPAQIIQETLKSSSVSAGARRSLHAGAFLSLAAPAGGRHSTKALAHSRSQSSWTHGHGSQPVVQSNRPSNAGATKLQTIAQQFSLGPERLFSSELVGLQLGVASQDTRQLSGIAMSGASPGIKMPAASSGRKPSMLKRMTTVHNLPFS